MLQFVERSCTIAVSGMIKDECETQKGNGCKYKVGVKRKPGKLKVDGRKSKVGFVFLS